MSNLRIKNTESKQKEDFMPIDPPKVKVYHCGPTVYWHQHIGNMRGMVMGDLVRRTLEYLGYDVEFARNYTDVGHLTGDNIGDADSGEDRMAKGARREGLTPDEIADKYIAQFEKDTESLNIISPTHKPRATEYVPKMIEMVETLLEKGFAYVTEQAVYFDVSKAEDYTRLSGQKLELNETGAGHGDVVDKDKRHSQDFSLWFFKTGAHENALQTWESPFESPAENVENGEGFPGWHIECSAMAVADLGKTIDIHIGGIEHIPVHHTNEIAQAESATGKKFVNYWLHNEWLTLDGGKISKSEGKVILVEDITDNDYDPIALRYLFLQAHYRSQQDFTWDNLDAAATAYEKLVHHLKHFLTESDLELVNLHELSELEGHDVHTLEMWEAKFAEAISDDFNLPKALAVVWDLVKDKTAEPKDKLVTILDFDRVLGLKLIEKIEEAVEDHEFTQEEVDKIELLIADRNKARKNKDFGKADQIRELLEKEYDIELTDKGDKTEWSVK